MRAGATVIVALLLCAPLASRAAAATPDAGARLLVRFHSGASAGDRAAAIRSVGASMDTEIRALGITRVVLPSAGSDAVIAARRIARDPAVAFVEPDGVARLQFFPNDALWSSDPYTGLGQWGLRKALVDRAWDKARGSPQVVVAIIDTGVDPGHPDLKDAVLPGVRFVSAPTPECGSGPDDDNSHGTHIAGIVGASGNNSIGISGVAFGVRILPVKALDCAGTGVVSDIAEAIVWATDHGAKIVNISLGTTTDSLTLQSAVKYAIDRDVLVVSAAGNCGAGGARCGGDNVPQYPAASPGVLAVGATSTDDAVAAFSTQGPQLALVAPGFRIVSTTPRYATFLSGKGTSVGYASLSGTSQASAFVAGVAALIWSAEPGLSAQAVFDRLANTADDLGEPGRDDAYGAGRVNALRALGPAAASFDASAVPHAVTAGSTFVARVRVTNGTGAMWEATGPSPVSLAYHWIDRTGRVVVWDGTRTPLPADLPPGGSATLAASVTAPQAASAYALRLDLVRDGVAWFSQRGVPPVDVAVTVGRGFAASYAAAAGADTLMAGSRGELAVTLANTGVRSWAANAVRLAYHWLRPDGAVVLWDGSRAAPFATDVVPGARVAAPLRFEPPATGGPYVLRLDLVEEGVAWFSAEDVAAFDLGYIVISGDAP